MDIPEALVSQITEGRAVLLLGAGASLDSTNPEGLSPPTPQELSDRLASKFLSASHVGHDLTTVAELAISETSLPDVQDYIAGLLTDFEPSAAHLLLPTFRWHGLATTNYDRLIEVAYDRGASRAQNLAPVISDADRMDDPLKSTDTVSLLKLHGCVSRSRDNQVPFILTTDQYVSHRRHRDNLFRTLKEWCSDRTLIGVGHSLRDSDLRQVLLELDELGVSRPRYYIVGPDFTAAEQRLWESRRITPLRGTFNEFLSTLDAKVPSPLRRVATTTHTDHPVSRWITRPLLSSTLEYLDSEAELVHSSMDIDSIEPAMFYRGVSPAWAAIDQELDVRRRVVDTVLYDAILPDDADRASPVDFFVLRAEAGAGKTICLQRIAWEAAVDAERFCLFVKSGGYLDYDAVADVVDASDERVFLFVDNAAEHVSELDHLIRRSRSDRLRLTVITAERQNQWNIYCERLESHLSAYFRIQYLNHDEITRLIALLERHGSLGYLHQLSNEERVAELQERAGRQLLVALLEATQGKPYEEILVDEYNRIVPERAQALYLTVCVLNRLDIPVRAGLISRVHGIAFSEFQERLFAPLEHVVRTREDKRIKDYVYVARHPLIAQVVFERILVSRERRFDEYLRLVSSLNLSYGTDYSAFRQMIRGRVVHELFPSHEDARAILDAAMRIAPADAHVLHQAGIYEMNRPNGNLSAAYDFLARASEIAPRDSTITHSIAELERRRADASTTDVERKKHRDEAIRLARTLQSDPVQGPYGYHTILKTHTDRLREIIADPATPDDDLDRMLQTIEETLAVALQRFPDDEYILAGEAEVAKLLQDEERARAALEQAFARNPRSPYIASRLASALERLGRVEEALGVLETAVSANSSDRQLNFAYAMMLRNGRRDNPETMLHHLRRSFTPGDRNFEAQFWYAYYLYITDTNDGIEMGRQTFRQLWGAPLPYNTRTRIRAHFVGQDGTKSSFTGSVRRREDSYGWIVRDGAGDSIMVRSENLGPGVWATLRERDRVRFEIGFCLGGAVAVNISQM